MLESQTFPRKERLTSVVWGRILMTSVSLFVVCPSSAWGGERGRIPFNSTQFEYLRQRDSFFFLFVFMIKHPNIYPSGDYQSGFDPRDFGYQNYFSS